VYAASSLTEPVEAFAREWTKRTGQVVRPQFEASSTLARQILEGAPADLFLSAAPEWLDRVHPKDRFDWVGNRLVVVVRKDATEFHWESVESLALANEQVPAGKYARAALASLHVKLPERILYGANVRDVLSKVAQGGAMAGVVYATDAAIDPGVRIALTFPPESHPPILYSAGLLTPRGKALFDALREPWVLEVMRRHGFVDIK
jgi:molybdate transport system substrate-binding protein